jgi:hypothetical protein
MAILIKIALCAQYALKMQSRIRSHWSTRSLKTPHGHIQGLSKGHYICMYSIRQMKYGH